MEDDYRNIRIFLWKKRTLRLKFHSEILSRFLFFTIRWKTA